MKKQIGIKIISNLILLILVVSIFYTPIAQAASESTLSNLYSNPNQSSNNTYKFKIKDVVNSNLLTSIVGCTGTVSKVSEWMSRFIQSPLQMGKLAKEEIAKKKKQLLIYCPTTSKEVIETLLEVGFNQGDGDSSQYFLKLI